MQCPTCVQPIWNEMLLVGLIMRTVLLDTNQVRSILPLLYNYRTVGFPLSLECFAGVFHLFRQAHLLPSMQQEQFRRQLRRLYFGFLVRPCCVYIYSDSDTNSCAKATRPTKSRSRPERFCFNLSHWLRFRRAPVE